MGAVGPMAAFSGATWSPQKALHVLCLWVIRVTPFETGRSGALVLQINSLMHPPHPVAAYLLDPGSSNAERRQNRLLTYGSDKKPW